MEHILACIDASGYADSVCDYAAWGSARLNMPVEVLHVVQRADAVAARGDLSGAIGLGEKSRLMEELVELEANQSRLAVERGRILLDSAEKRLLEASATQVCKLHRHGGIVETILEREENAHIVVIGKRGGSHEFAADHIGSKIERVVRASTRPVFVASRQFSQPRNVVLAYDASRPAERALSRLAESPVYAGLPVHLVMADTDNASHRRALDEAAARLAGDREVKVTLQSGKPEAVIANIVEQTPDAVLAMGAYGHSAIRTLIVGSTTTTMIRTVRAPVLLVR